MPCPFPRSTYLLRTETIKTDTNIHSSNGYSTTATIDRLNERTHEKAFLSRFWVTKRKEDDDNDKNEEKEEEAAKKDKTLAD